MEKTVETVRRVIAVEMAMDLEDVKPESRWVEDLGLDSLDAMEVVMSLEDQFRIDVPDRNIDEWERAGATVQGLAELVALLREYQHAGRAL